MRVQKTNSPQEIIYLTLVHPSSAKLPLGLPLRLQDLRHSFANFLVSIGINQRDLHSILGHYKPETLALVRNNTLANNAKINTQEI